MSANRREFLGAAVAGAVVMPKPGETAPLYVHAWAEKLVPLPAGGYGSEIIQVSEGPFELAAAETRMAEIATTGLRTGVHYFPVGRVHLVELRGGAIR